MLDHELLRCQDVVDIGAGNGLILGKPAPEDVALSRRCFYRWRFGHNTLARLVRERNPDIVLLPGCRMTGIRGMLKWQCRYALVSEISSPAIILRFSPP